MIGITASGVDEFADPHAVGALLASFEELELGLLYRGRASNNGARHVSLEWLARVVPLFERRFAIHLCGPQARKDLLEGRLDHVLTRARRLQINGIVDPALLERMAERAHVVQQIVTQHGAKNTALLDLALPRHAILVDDSGGRGRRPERWVRPLTAKLVGFAGGVGPDDLAGAIPAIATVAGASLWVDMEASLRDVADRFDVHRATRTLEAFPAGVAAIGQATPTPSS